MTSIFTRIARKELPAHIVWEDAEFMALMALAPISSGHLLLAPKAEVDTIYNLTERAYYRLWQIVKCLEAPLRRVPTSISFPSIAGATWIHAGQRRLPSKTCGPSQSGFVPRSQADPRCRRRCDTHNHSQAKTPIGPPVPSPCFRPHRL